MSEWAVETIGLAKTFSSGWRHKTRVDAVSDLDLQIGRGEIFAFLGPNGAGKTTTINLLMGFLRPSRGSVKLFNMQPDERQVRARIGYLPENYAFYGFLTAPKLLDYFGRLLRIEPRVRRERIDRLLVRLGLWDARNQGIGKFSRGMRQRLGIIQALLNKPDLLILDEPTSGFDPLGRKMVRDLLLELKSLGTSIFLSSHILSEVETICDRVAVVHRGRLVRQGTLQEVIGSQSGYEITYSDPQGTVGARLREMNLPVTTAQEQFGTTAEDEETGQKAVDVIRAGGGCLRSYISKVRTLEDVFFDLVKEKESVTVPTEAAKEQP